MNHGVYPAAIIVTIFVAGIFGTIAVSRSKESWRFLLVVFLLSIPEFVVGFYFVRLPLDRFLRSVATPSPASPVPLWFILLSFLYAPVLEELAKFIPLLLPFIRRKITIRNRLSIGLAVGLGFGIGEIWFLAHQVARTPGLAGYPWYQYGGFVYERLFSCLFHGVFAAVTVRGLAGGIPRYLATAMGLHAATNLPILLFGTGLIRIDPSISQLVLLGYLPIFAVGAIFMMTRMAKSDRSKIETEPSNERAGFSHDQTKLEGARP